MITSETDFSSNSPLGKNQLIDNLILGASRVLSSKTSLNISLNDFKGRLMPDWWLLEFGLNHETSFLVNLFNPNKITPNLV